MRVVIVTFPGSNCDRDVSIAVTKITGKKPLSIWHQDHEIPNCDLVIIPGGFSYGDYLRCGAVAANSPIMREVKNHASRGGAVLGICNGFQILLEAKLLNGALIRNSKLKFVCKEVNLKISTNINSPFLDKVNREDTIKLPIAHNEGNFFADEKTLERIEGEGLVAMRYYNTDNNSDYNPNGSINDIAGILSENGKILGMMPHPERYIEEELGGLDGYKFLKNSIDNLS